MTKRFLFAIPILMIAVVACSRANGLTLPTSTPSPTIEIPTVPPPTLTPIPTPTPTPRASPTIPPTPNPRTGFGVLVSGDHIAQPEIVRAVNDLGATWVRLNIKLGEPTQDYKLFLDANVNVVLTLSNHDANNIDTTYGTLRDYPNAGFPFKSKTIYQQRIRDALAPAAPYLSSGRVWAQIENEVGDASLAPESEFWRGTTDQYLAQLAAAYDAIKSLNPATPVALTSLPSETLDVLLDANNPRHIAQTNRVTRLFTEGKYDAVDLHFYGCVEDISAKVNTIKKLLPSIKPWISTENGGPDSRCRTTPISWQRNSQQFEQTQAQQVPLRLSACADNGGRICLWFALIDLKDETDVFNHLGLIDPRITPPRLKPAYDAFKTFVKTHSTTS